MCFAHPRLHRGRCGLRNQAPSSAKKSALGIPSGEGGGGRGANMTCFSHFPFLQFSRVDLQLLFLFSARLSRLLLVSLFPSRAFSLFSRCFCFLLCCFASQTFWGAAGGVCRFGFRRSSGVRNRQMQHVVVLLAVSLPSLWCSFVASLL